MKYRFIEYRIKKIDDKQFYEIYDIRDFKTKKDLLNELSFLLNDNNSDQVFEINFLKNN